MPVTLLYGTNRLPPNLVWFGDFTAIAHTEKQEGGKGGGGGGSNTTYTYTASFLHALCEGPIHSVRRGWVNKEVLSDPATKFQLLNGALDQSPWSHLVGHHPDEALAYSETACLGTVGYELGNNASMPNHNFEVVGLLPLSPAATPVPTGFQRTPSPRLEIRSTIRHRKKAAHRACFTNRQSRLG